MPSKIVRCSNCGDIVETEPGTCSSCGAPLKLLPAPTEPQSSYAEKYRGTEFDQSLATQQLPPVAPPTQNYATLLIGVGIAVVVVIVAVSALVMNSAQPTPTLGPRIVAYTPTPTPEPTAAPILQTAYDYLTSATLAAKLTVHTDYLLDARVNGVADTVTIDLTAMIDGGNSKGHYSATGRQSFDFVCLVDKWYTKPTGKSWSGPTGTACALNLFQLFNLTAANQLAVDGEETLNGQHTFRLIATSKWGCDPTRLSLMSTLNRPLQFQPEHPTLTIWVDDAGRPVKAFLAADYQSPSDGKRLMTLETTWNFSDVGIPNDIKSPK